MSLRSRPLLAALAVLLLAAPAGADPCGMVPPLWEGPGPAITRVGLQQTYVFYKDERAPRGAEEVFAFRYQGITYVGWAGTGWYETLHFEPRGLVREVQIGS